MARSFNIHQSIAATTTVADVIGAQGINAFFGRAAGITLYGNCDTVATMTWAAFADDGTTVVGLVPTGSTLPAASTAGKVKANEDFIGQFAIPAGNKLLLSVTNPTAGALLANFLVVVN
jgi:hypothetical protein